MTSTPFGATKTATLNGTTLAYREEGTGEPVVFTHGGISDLRIWDRQLPEVGRSYRAIAYSQRFHPPNEDSDPGSGDLSLVAVEDLAAFLQEIDAAPAHLVGNSYGAYVNLVVAIRHPELVRTLVIEEPPVMPLFVSLPPRPAELLRLLVTRPRTGIGIVQFGATMTKTLKLMSRGEETVAAQVFTRGVLDKKAFEQLSQERWEQILENLAEFRALEKGAQVFPPIDDDGVRGVRAPALLLTGERSPAWLLRLTDRLEELLPQVERQEIPDASHLMHEDNPAAVNKAILDFLGRRAS
jgi:pimeloyl-ACP methyl ester carboxylesterase